MDTSACQLTRCLVRNCGLGLDVQGPCKIAVLQSVIADCGMCLINNGDNTDLSVVDLSDSILYGK